MKRKILTILFSMVLVATCCCFFACGEEEEHAKYPEFTFTVVKDDSGKTLGLEVDVARPQDLNYLSTIVVPESSHYYKETAEGEIKDHNEAMAVIAIADGAFRNNVSLQSIVLPKYVEKIGVSCFELCSKLGSITINSEVNYIGDKAFNGCSNLSEIRMQDKEKAAVLNIGQEAFASCIKLRSLGFEFGKGSEIKDKAFYYDANLPILDLTNASYVGSGAFKGCQNTDKYTLPSSISSWDIDWNK